ncbi:GNAT family N-acetyltransferase [Anoxynatronum buryatiense]|uniref:Ribosomal-protein-serine acetyltransferase n=1 Tax=Anoxynatronum buryatiense TaxID=489973 RepID=A0AA46AIK2_9CLOT|nr:GNAT family protein [Anoxynatronum buryatiense]SMP51281.1 ribosomal-protein-serine acetyltransferase [Anoxynatronum buryatiense]
MFSWIIDHEKRLELRLLELSQADALFRLTEENRGYLRQWLPWLDAIQRVEDTGRFIESTQEQHMSNSGFQAGIWSEERLVGIIGHHGINWPNRSTSLGYWLGEAHSGSGIMTAACRAVVAHAFEEWHLNRVEIRCATGNHKSRAIPQRLGFVAEGVLREAEWLYDHYVDHVVYAMLASEWKSEKGGTRHEIPSDQTP